MCIRDSDNGGTVHGIITETLASRGAAYKKIQDLKIVPDMDHRKEKNDGNG